ncbi:hypothetical protein [Sphingomonas sp. 3-13AW]|uniref:hypothetical protein n=1 Tax=Sphingomonas sp. 3-13AW TaxID=3050450 RepID=UPI003BB7F3CE
MMHIVLPPVISLTGVGQVGKSEVANYLRERYGYGGDHINEPMVAMAIPLLERMGCSRSDAVARLTTERKAEPIPGYEWLSGRKVLQAVGYDLRNALGRTTSSETGAVDAHFFLDMWERRHSHFERLVNESARYPVEINWTDNRGGVVILVDAPGAVAANSHVSETKSLPHDYLLVNEFDGLGKLHAKVDAIVTAWSSPENKAYDLFERRTRLLHTEHSSLCERVAAVIALAAGLLMDFEDLEQNMVTSLLGRTDHRFAGNKAKAREMEAWLKGIRAMDTMRVAAVICHYGVERFQNSSFRAAR